MHKLKLTADFFRKTLRTLNLTTYSVVVTCYLYNTVLNQTGYSNKCYTDRV